MYFYYILVRFITEAWQKIEVDGRGDFRFCEKLKNVKVSLRWWKRVVFGWVDLRVEELVGDLNDLDSLLVNIHGVL